MTDEMSPTRNADPQENASSFFLRYSSLPLLPPKRKHPVLDSFTDRYWHVT